ITHSVVLGDAAPSADQDLVGFRIVRFDAQAGRARPVGVKLPSQTKIESQLRRHAPAVAHIESEYILQTIHFDVLAALPRARRRAEQKARKAVPAVLEGWSASLES